MKRSRLLVSTLVSMLAAMSLSVAVASLSDSGAFQHTITAADSFGASPGMVWVCKLVGPPDNPRVAEGKNPIQVSINSVEAKDAFSDAHPNYVVQEGDAKCQALKYEGSAPDDSVEGNKDDPDTSQGTGAEDDSPQIDESSENIEDSVQEPEISHEPDGPTTGTDGAASGS